VAQPFLAVLFSPVVVKAPVQPGALSPPNSVPISGRRQEFEIVIPSDARDPLFLSVLPLITRRS